MTCFQLCVCTYSCRRHMGTCAYINTNGCMHIMFAHKNHIHISIKVLCIVIFLHQQPDSLYLSFLVSFNPFKCSCCFTAIKHAASSCQNWLLSLWLLYQTDPGWCGNMSTAMGQPKKILQSGSPYLAELVYDWGK